MKRPSVIATVFLSEAGIEALRRPLRGDGGFQLLMARCRATLDERSRTFTVSLEDWARLQRYASAHGRGGYQSRLQAILGDAAAPHEV